MAIDSFIPIGLGSGIIFGCVVGVIVALCFLVRKNEIKREELEERLKKLEDRSK